MSVCPFIFKQNTETPIETLSLNYSFDVINSITTIDTTNELNEGLSINQTPKIPAIILNLGGRTSNANMSIGINGKVTPFNLYDAYITNVFPKIKNNNEYSFVIEGFSSQNIGGEKILIYIPINPVGITSGENPFSLLVSALVNESTPPKLKEITNNINIDFNKFIPNNKYYYYNYTDSIQTTYNIISFDSSNLSYDTNFGNILSASFNKDKNPKSKMYFEQIGSKDVAINTTPLYISKSNPTNQDVITKSYEDNIYIDCQPTDNVNKDSEDNYMQSSVKQALGLVKYIEISFPYIIFIICLTLIVICIFSLSSILKKYVSTTVSDSKQP